MNPGLGIREFKVSHALTCLKTVLLITFVFSPALFCGWAMRESSVNVPMWDDWQRGPLLYRFYEGTLDFEYLASPQIDHRILWPRLIILVLNELSSGDLQAEMALTAVSQFALAIILFFLVRRTFPVSAWSWLVSFLINLWLFLPLQYQNFLWGIQIAFMQPFLWLGVAIFAASHPRLNLIWKIVICALSACLGTFSFSHGILIWPIVLGLFLLQHSGCGKNLRTRLIGCLVFGAVAAAVLSFYFLWNFKVAEESIHSYFQEPGETPPALARLDVTQEKSEKLLRIFLINLGNPLARLFMSDPYRAAQFAGLFTLLAYSAASLYLFWNWKRAEIRDRLLPWFGLGAFAILGAGALTLGRAWLGIEAALISRYASVTLFLPTALVPIGAFIFHRASTFHEKESSWLTRTAPGFAAGFCGALLLAHAALWTYGLHQMREFKSARLQARVSLLYSKVSPPQRVQRLDFDLRLIHQYADYLNSKGLLDPPLIEKLGFGNFRRINNFLSCSRAEIISCEELPHHEGNLCIQGFATLTGSGRMADGVLLAYIPWPPENQKKLPLTEDELSDAAWKVFEIAEMNPLPRFGPLRRDYQFADWRHLNYLEENARWDITVPQERLPAIPALISFWALDADRMHARPLRTQVLLSDFGAEILRDE